MRTSARMTGAVAATAVAALLVSGCGSSDDKGGKDESGGGKPAATPTSEQSDAAPADDGPGTLPGIWNTTAGGKQYVLTIAGDAVTLLREKTNCTGRVMDAGQQTLTLKCPGGTGEERTNGTVEKLKGKTMKVSWNGGATDTYTKVAEAPKTLPKDPKDLHKLIPGS